MENREELKKLKHENIKQRYAGRGWIYQGLLFGFICLVGTFFGFLTGENFSFNKVLYCVLICLPGGILYGYIIKKYFKV